MFWHELSLSGKTVTMIRGAQVQRMVFWHDLGLSGRNSHADSRREVPEIVLWHDSRSSNGCLPLRHFPQ
eukprot:3107696-Pyramimonas_sp.AAC.1